ncbi:OPT family oligopeptide transporter [Mitsuokella jalaludinii]|uniref:OPT family oligopeptide transporter n=1 Tax=Mitsuokella jalaludinii TaxID=187979 RepID=UPI0030796636
MSDENKTRRPYAPRMSPHQTYEEINSYVVFWGLFFSVLFALAVGYLCLKIGQTVDAFAPVSVLAMGMAVLFHRRNAFPETVHIQAIASAGTNIIGGAMFILPALYILNIEDVSFLEMAIPIVLGGVLGVFLATVFRRYFCEEMDGVYPFPSGSAAAEVLESDEGSKAHIMLVSGAVALVYDFVLNSIGWWQELLTTTTFHWGQVLADKYKLVFSLDNDAALLGIGMLAMSGIIGLLSMSGVVVRVVKRAVADLFSKGASSSGMLLRTQQDLPMTQIVFVSLLMTILFAVFFHVMCAESLTQTVIAFVLVMLFALMLSVVGISSIAFTGNEPVSGMTIFMIIVSAVVMGGAGMAGKTGIIAILMMAAFLCATLAVSSNFMSELKVAYITGATPKKMQQWQLVSIVLAGVVSVGVVFLMHHAYGFTGEGALAAPQANAMAAIVKPMMDGGDAPWPLYMAGAFFAVLLWMMKIPPLAFALGSYLPMGINTPVLVGGLISYFVSHSSDDAKVNAKRLSEGNTVASGFVAGGAIGSLISAVLHIAGIVAYFVLCIFLYAMAKRAVK